MGRQRAPVKVNQFIGGLNTEASPLAFPDNSTFDERNMELARDGSRVRRNGFDLETLYEDIDTAVVLQAGVTLARSQFRWENPGGITGTQFLVVQIGNYLAIHDVGQVPVSSTPLYTKTFSDPLYSSAFGYAGVDGLLVVATGRAELTILKYEDEIITEEEGELLIRDFFGVSATDGVDVLTEYQNLQKRPEIAPAEHIYNLRNQTFALPKPIATDSESPRDPIKAFYAASQNTESVWPSNSDNLNYHLLANPNDDSNRTVERFDHRGMIVTPPNNTKAPSGYFVINALRRGASRLEQINKLYAENSVLDYPVSSLPADITPRGATVLAEHSGRVWYSGFSGGVVGGDELSPSLSSYILFSQVVQSPSQVFNCFQQGDPTSSVDADLIDTDGGFIKIGGAYGIKGLLSVETSLFVFAENGIWKVTGIDENGFTATGYTVSKLSEEGCVSAPSIVSTGVAILYWGVNGIFAITKDRFGAWGVASVTESTIQTLYDDIPATERQSCVGYYDSLHNSVRWVYGFLGETELSKELVLNVKFNAFTLNSVANLSTGVGILSISGGQRVTVGSEVPITSEGVVVTSDAEDVYISLSDLQRDPSESFYCVMIAASPTIHYTFGGYRRDDTMYDWDSLSPVDSPAYLLTGSATGGDARVRKNVPYLSVHLKVVGDGSEEALESSCMLSSQWNWTTTSAQGKFSPPRQAYRPSRVDEGSFMAQTRNKIRGSGRSVAFKFASEPGKTMHIFGWEFDMEATTDE